MKTKLLSLSWAFIALTLIFSACSDDDVTPTPPEGDITCLIVNQGNFTEKNSSISFYNEKENTVTNNVFYKANNRYLSAFVESAALYDTIAFIICNSPDKIEVVDSRTAKTIISPIDGENIINPRYAVLGSNYAYVTCWGTPNQYYIYPESYLLKIDMKTLQIVKKIDCSNEPEGLLLVNGILYIATAEGVDIFNTSDDSKSKTIPFKTFTGKGKHLAADDSGRIWCSVESEGFASINMAALSLEDEVAISGTQGSFGINNKNKIIYFYTGGYDEENNWAPFPNPIYTLNTNSKNVSTTIFYDGESISGINVNPETGLIYTAEIYGYTANSKVKVLAEDGKLNNEFSAGVGAGRFIFY